MTAARSPWAWSSCCSQVALRRAIAHPGRLGCPTSMVSMHTCSGNPVADSVLLPAAPAHAAELPVIPLWQLVNQFAYHKSVKGVPQRPFTLYQDIEHWQVELRVPSE